MLIRALALRVCLVVFCGQILCSQTISPAPTEAGYPFHPAYGCCQSKIIRGEDRNAWFNAAGRIGRMNINGTQKYYVVNQNGSWPLGVTYGPDNKIWFTLFEGKVGRLNPATGGVTYWPLPPNSHARDITPGSDGALWFPTGPQIGRITTSGVITFFPSPFGASALRTARDGSLWMIDTFGRKIARMTTLGRVTNV